MDDAALIDDLLDASPALWGDELDAGPVGRVPRDRTVVETPKRTARRLGRQDACVAQLRELPEPGSELLLMMDGRWHGWDLVEAVRQLAGCDIAHLRAATLGFNKTQARHIADLLDDGSVGRVSIVVGAFFSEKSPEEYETLRQVMQSRGQPLAATRNHAKLLLFELADGRRIAVHGSLNLRSCTCFEQAAITADPAVHDFFASYIDDATGGGA